MYLAWVQQRVVLEQQDPHPHMEWHIWIDIWPPGFALASDLLIETE